VFSPLLTIPATQVLLNAADVRPASIGLPPDDGPPGWFGCNGASCTNRYANPNLALLAFALPGVVNLLPFIWLFAVDRRVKAAAVVAGLCGLVRVAIPVLLLVSVLSNGDYKNPADPLQSPDQWPGFQLVRGNDGKTYLWHGEDWLGPPDSAYLVWLPGAVAWLGTLGVWGMFTLITSPSHGSAISSRRDPRTAGRG
jgi:hypothetical protein